MTATELAADWRNELLEFDDALIEHLMGNLGLKPDVALVLGIGTAISWVNMGQGEVVLDLPGCPQMTADEIVKKFGVEAFVEDES